VPLGNHARGITSRGCGERDGQHRGCRVQGGVFVCAQRGKGRKRAASTEPKRIRSLRCETCMFALVIMLLCAQLFCPLKMGS